MPEDRVLAEATFNPKVRWYWLLGGALIFALTIVGIVLLPIWFLVGLKLTQVYLDRMACTLTDRAVKVRKGVLTRIEKTIPLEKITDVGMVEGPLMRLFGLKALSLETAGQSGGVTGALVQLVGIEDAVTFRDRVLEQRDVLAAGDSAHAAPSTSAPAATTDAQDVLIEIRDSLHRIEERLADR